MNDAVSPPAIPDDDRALAQSFRAMAENVPGALFRYVLWPDGRDSVEYMSPHCLDLWEVEAEAIVDDATILWKMVDADDLPGMQASVMASARTLEPWYWEWRITTPSGRRKWVEGRGRPERRPDGSVLWNSLILDVTERRRTEEALRHSEQRLAHVLEVTGEGLWHWDIAADVVEHNRRWCEIVGVDESWMRHPVRDFENLLHPDDRDRVMASVQRCLREGVPHRSEHRIACPGGREVWVSDRGGVVERDAEGRALRMAGSIADITARKLAEFALRIKDAAIESSLNGIALADLEGRLTYVNPAFCRLWGITAEQAVGRSAIDFWRVPKHPQAVIESLHATGRWIGELEGQRADGTLFHAEVSASLVRGTDGQPQCLMGSFVDVTARHRADEALRHINDELESRIEERTAALAQAKAEAERANQAKSEFLSSMSHELRTPLNAVLGFAQLLELDATMTPRSRDWLREILRAGHHLLDLINEVLDLARIESGRMALSLEPVELAAVVDEALALMQPLAATRRVTLPAAGRIPPVSLRADRTRLKQVLMNLLSNAVKYNAEGGRVEIDVVPGEPQRLRVTVTDTGSGIPPERIDELFRPFHRLTTDATVEGTGIGLVITRRLVELMGGTIGVCSTPGQGSSFWFDLPLAEVIAPPPAPASAAAEAVTTGTHWRVLYIDDNPGNLRLMAEMLAQRPGLELLTAPSPGLGLDLARAHRPALILLDLQLPGIDGFQVLARLRQDPALAGIPVVAVTSLGTARDVQRGRAAGFADYVVKPVVVAEMLATIDRLLGRPAA